MEAEANSREAEAVVPILDELAAARLRKLVLLQGNDECADCRAPEPTWASVGQGVFVCTQCAGVHRSLGGAAVVSIKLDKWTEEQLAAMEAAGGNDKANEQLEFHVPKDWPHPAKDEAREYREKYIKAKHEAALLGAQRAARPHDRRGADARGGAAAQLGVPRAVGGARARRSRGWSSTSASSRCAR